LGTKAAKASGSARVVGNSTRKSTPVARSARKVGSCTWRSTPMARTGGSAREVGSNAGSAREVGDTSRKTDIANAGRTNHRSIAGDAGARNVGLPGKLICILRRNCFADNLDVYYRYYDC